MATDYGRRITFKDGQFIVSAGIIGSFNFSSVYDQPAQLVHCENNINQTLTYYFNDDINLPICSCSLANNTTYSYWNGRVHSPSGSYDEDSILFVAHDLEEALVIYQKLEVVSNLSPTVDGDNRLNTPGQNNLDCKLFMWKNGVTTQLDSWSWNSEPFDNFYLFHGMYTGDHWRRAYITFMDAFEYIDRIPQFPPYDSYSYKGALFGLKSSLAKWDGDNSIWDPNTGGLFRQHDEGQSWYGTWYYPRIYLPPARGFGRTNMLTMTYPGTGGLYDPSPGMASGGPDSAFDGGAFSLYTDDHMYPGVCFGYKTSQSSTILPDGTKRVYYPHPVTWTTSYVDILPANRNPAVRAAMLAASGLTSPDFLTMQLRLPR